MSYQVFPINPLLQFKGAYLQICIICNDTASNFNLLVNRHQETICSVIDDGVSNFQ